MLKLTQFESNLTYWTKHHYEGHGHESFWPQLGEIYKGRFLMDDLDLEGAYHMVRNLWSKILDTLPNKEFFLDKYESETLPSRVRYYWGAPNHESAKLWHCKDVFSENDIIAARIVVMVSQISCTEVKYYQLLEKQEFAGLKLKNPVKESHLP